MSIWSRFLSNKTAPRIQLSRHPQEVLVICDGGDIAGTHVVDNLLPGLELAKMRYSLLDLELQSAWPPLGNFASLVVTCDFTGRLSPEQIWNLRDYVNDGGGLMVAYRCWDNELADLFGAPERIDPDTTQLNGLEFVAELVPGLSGLKVGDADWVFDHRSYELSRSDLASACSVLVTARSGEPIAWRNRFGSGSVIYWNTSELYSRSMRGYLIQCVLMTMGVGVCAVAAIGVFQVDDFPPSLSDEVLEPIKTEYGGIDCSQFYFGVWYDDMMALRKRHGIKYTWYAVMDYDDVAQTDIPDPQFKVLKSGRKILQMRFDRITGMADEDEFAFHGYNHVPLTDEYCPDPEILETRLKLARSMWEETVPAPLPVSWVPANNWYQPDQLRVLTKVFPKISVVCGTYSTGDMELGQHREFGVEPWSPSLLCFPRQTFGYVLTPKQRLLMLSQIASVGIWTHFLHPDDVYQLPSPDGTAGDLRNELGLYWNHENQSGEPGMLRQLDNWLHEVRSNFPWLEFLTTSAAAAKFRDYISNDVKVTCFPDFLEFDCDRDCIVYVRVAESVQLQMDDAMEILDSRQVTDGCIHVVKVPAGRSEILKTMAPDLADQ